MLESHLEAIIDRIEKTRNQVLEIVKHEQTMQETEMSCFFQWLNHQNKQLSHFSTQLVFKYPLLLGELWFAKDVLKSLWVSPIPMNEDQLNILIKVPLEATGFKEVFAWQMEKVKACAKIKEKLIKEGFNFSQFKQSKPLSVGIFDKKNHVHYYDFWVDLLQSGYLEDYTFDQWYGVLNIVFKKNEGISSGKKCILDLVIEKYQKLGGQEAHELMILIEKILNRKEAHNKILHFEWITLLAHVQTWSVEQLQSKGLEIIDLMLKVEKTTGRRLSFLSKDAALWWQAQTQLRQLTHYIEDSGLISNQLKDNWL